jgi:outer membrane protein
METDFSRALRRIPLILAAALLGAGAGRRPLRRAGRRAALSGLADAPRPASRPTSASRSDLAEVVDIALCNNPQTRQGWASARVQAAQVGVAQAAFLPSLSAGASVSRLRNEATRRRRCLHAARGIGVDLSWVLFDFGARAASLENARQLFAAASSTRDATLQAVFLAAVQAFFQRQAAAAVLEASRLSEKAALESLNAAEARYRVGSATPADRLQARTAHAQAVLNRIGAEGAVKTAQGTLANVLGVDPTRPLSLAPLPPAAPGAGVRGRRRPPDRGSAPAAARPRRGGGAVFRAAQAGVDAAKAATCRRCRWAWAPAAANRRPAGL